MKIQVLALFVVLTVALVGCCDKPTEAAATGGGSAAIAAAPAAAEAPAATADCPCGVKGADGLCDCGKAKADCDCSKPGAAPGCGCGAKAAAAEPPASPCGGCPHAAKAAAAAPASPCGGCPSAKADGGCAADGAPAVKAKAVAIEHVGAEMTGAALADFAALVADPKAFEGQTLALKGTVKSLCKETGAWFVVEGADGTTVRVIAEPAFKTDAKYEGWRVQVEGTVAAAEIKLPDGGAQVLAIIKAAGADFIGQ